jgi:hypothetical protein
MPSARAQHSVSVLDGLIYVVGVQEPSGQDMLRYDPSSGAWSTLSPGLTPDHYGSSFVLGGYLYAVGGWKSSASVERNDVDADTWMAVSNLLEGRSCFCSVTSGSASPAEEEDLFDILITTATFRTHPSTIDLVMAPT